MKHQGSTIVAMHGKIGILAAITEGPSLPETGSQDGDLDTEGVTLHETDQGRS